MVGGCRGVRNGLKSWAQADLCYMTLGGQDEVVLELNKNARR